MYSTVLQAVEPRLLIFVEGVSQNCRPILPKYPAFWGGALDSAGDAPVRLSVTSKLVYSPHVYGPGASLAAHAACSVSTPPQHASGSVSLPACAACLASAGVLL